MQKKSKIIAERNALREALSDVMETAAMEYDCFLELIEDLHPEHRETIESVRSSHKRTPWDPLWKIIQKRQKSQLQQQ